MEIEWYNMFWAIRRVLDENPDVKAIYPIHMNSVVGMAADEELGDCEAEYGEDGACERIVNALEGKACRGFIRTSTLASFFRVKTEFILIICRRYDCNDMRHLRQNL